MKKMLENILLEAEGKRMIVRDGKIKYYNDEMKRFPLRELIGQTAALVKVHDNLIVEIRLSNGQVFPVTTPKTEASSKVVEPKNEKNMTTDPNRKPARAPYNFVPLNKEIIKGQETASFDDFHNDRCSGFIDLNITALTDIFIRGELEKFFMINNQFAIPGSSLRGLIRSLTEIVSYSGMEFTDKKRKLFFRNIGDAKYKDKFLKTEEVSGRKLVSQNSRAGWLSKVGKKIYLKEAPRFYKVSRRRLEDLGKDKTSTYHFEDIWFDENRVQPIKNKRIEKYGKIVANFDLAYNIATTVSITPRDGFTKGTLLITGLFGKNKHYQWIIPPPIKEEQYDVTDFFKDYALDENRDENADLLQALNKSKGEPIPCFYIPDDKGKPKAVGHTGIFRFPYEHNIGHAIKQEHIGTFDIAQTIFGYASSDEKKESILAGRVYFEDAIATNIAGKEFGALRILSSPKPTSFQLYLEQHPNSHNYKIKDAELHNWDTGSHVVRGSKLYWHKETNWRNPKVVVTADTKRELILKALELKNEQYTVGEVLKKDSSFNGRIRFENLTRIELGTLLFTLDLQPDCAHKLGMGKSLGLGSVKITPSLTLIDRRKRYEELFSDDNTWNIAEKHETDLEQFKNAFAKYIGEKTNQSAINSADDYWGKDSRMKELKELLTFEHKTNGVSWENRTRYMLIEHPTNDPKNEYKDRRVLPKPSEVIRNETYQES